MTEETDQNEQRYAQIHAQARWEFLKASKLEYAVSLVAYFIVGLPLLDIKFLGYLLFSLVFNLITGVVTGPIYAAVATKRYQFDDDDAFDKWYGTTYYFPVLGIHLLFGILSAVLFKYFWG